MAGPLYQLESIVKSLGPGFALRVPALRLEPGCMYTLMGPNGSGKTTLLGLLAFLSQPTAGALRFDGVEVPWKPAALLRLRRQATLVHQSPYLFSGSVAENLGIGLEHRRLPREEVRERVAAALASVDLAGFEPRAARTLSGGEARRVAVARALLVQPRALLLDEPLANLDQKSTGVLEKLIAGLPATGLAVVIASHDPDLPGRFGSVVVELAEGRLVGCPPRLDGRDSAL